MPKLLVLDLSFTYEAIVQRKLKHSVTCRTLDGYFDHVWSVHPFASLLTSDEWGPRYGKPEAYRVDEGNTFIEGKIGRFKFLNWVMPVNFILSQAMLFRDLYHLIKTENIEVIRVGDPHYLGIFGWMLARATGAKLAIRVGANYDVNRERTGQPIQPRLFRSSRLEKMIEQFLFKRFDLIAGANTDNLEYAISNCAPRYRSTLFRYGNLIDESHLIPSDQRESGADDLNSLNLESGRFLLSVARLEYTNGLKRPSDNIELLRILRNRGHDVKLLLAGDGPLRPSLERMAKEADLEHHVVFAGNRDQKWLARLLPHAAVFVSPHAGRALSEAAFAGIPAVGYDIDWQREMLINGETGYLVPFGDFVALADGAHRLLSDPEAARRMGSALNQRARDILDPETLNKHERNVYGQLLSSEGFRAPHT